MRDTVLQKQLKELIDNNPMSSFQVVVVALCFILNMNDGMDVLVVSYSSTEIIKEWALSKSEMGWVFSTGLIGMTMGSLLLAPFGDKIGRRKVFILSLIMISLGMLLVYLTTSYWQLLILRIVTGIGIGGILPTMATITAEYSNIKSRDFNVGLIQGGWPVGAILTGFFAAWAIPEFGWRFVYLFAGTISLAMLIAVVFFMPESLTYLGKHRNENTLTMVNRLLSKLGHTTLNQLPAETENISITKTSIFPSLKNLLSAELKASTLRLWTGVFFGFLTLYTLMSWVPTIAKDAGMPFELATYSGVLLNLGAFLGVAAMGYSASRFGPRQTILTFMLIAFAIMLSYANLDLSFTTMLVLIFFIGFFVQGGFNTFFPISTRVYPASIRSTGVGMAMGFGRFGAILGPLIFGILSDWQLSIPTLFLIFSLPLLVAGGMAYRIRLKDR
jgi:benzoate transport